MIEVGDVVSIYCIPNQTFIVVAIDPSTRFMKLYGQNILYAEDELDKETQHEKWIPDVNGVKETP